MAKFLNPSNVHAPVGSYSHTVTVPAGTELLFISGQVGMRPDGSLPASFGEQAEAVFENIRSCLAAHRPTSTAVFVPQLVNPAFLLEVEAVAVKATAPSAVSSGSAA
jgi:enamine deaminase RidA (YjgF/YER057c/UK114 family)